MADFNTWKQNLPTKKQRSDVEKWYREQMRGDAADESEIKIKTKLENQMEHDRIVGKIALLFTPDDYVSQNSNCHFISYDPLCELGGKNADILIFHPDTHTALIIEVKTGQRDPISDFKKKREIIEKKRDYLEKMLKNNILNFEYLLVVLGLNRASELKNDCAENGFVLGFIEEDMLRLHSSSSLEISTLNEILKKGETLDASDAIHIMLGSHEFHILSNTLRQLIHEKLCEMPTSQDASEIKEFTKEEFKMAFQKLACIESIAKGSNYDKYMENRVDEWIKTGLDTGLIKSTTSNTYKIFAQATKSIGKIVQTMEKKYIDWYIDAHRKKIAEDNVKAQYRKKYKLQETLDL